MEGEAGRERDLLQDPAGRVGEGGQGEGARGSPAAASTVGVLGLREAQEGGAAAATAPVLLSREVVSMGLAGGPVPPAGLPSHAAQVPVVAATAAALLPEVVDTAAALLPEVAGQGGAAREVQEAASSTPTPACVLAAAERARRVAAASRACKVLQYSGTLMLFPPGPSIGHAAL